MRENKKSKDVKKSSIKAIAGFLNSHSGGNLIIGVNDDGEITGMSRDDYSSKDGAILDVGNAVESMLGLVHGGSCDIKAVDLGEEYVIHVKVRPSNFGPVHMKLGKRDTSAFFIRNGAQTRRLSKDEEVKYIHGHFKVEEK